METPVSSSSHSSLSTPRTPRADGIVIVSPSPAAGAGSTCLLRPKKESGSSGASSARLLQVKKEEGNAPSAPPAKKTRISTKEQLEYRTPDDP
jgi:hypothetical protein